MRGLLCLLLALGVAAAEEVTQTDWAGGGGVAGPVTDWLDTFDEAHQISWRSIPGQLVLASTPRALPTEHLIDPSFDGACAIHGCDLDGDGDTDVLGAARHADEIAWWRNDGGDPIQWTKTVIENRYAAAISVHGSDLDADGDTDVLAAAYDEGEVTWWRNDGGDATTWTRQTVGTLIGAHNVYAEDVDGDGVRDVLAVSQGEGIVTWWQNGGGDPITWTQQVITGGYPAASAVYATDVDGDGDADVMAASCVNPGSIAWWCNQGGDPIVWEEQVIDPDFALAHWVHAADFDGDGDTDVLGAAYTESDIAWWENDGGHPIRWEEHVIDTYFAGALVTHAADIDGDGDTDVMGTAGVANAVTWWENADGCGTAWEEHAVSTTATGAWAGHVADMDGDGDLDLLASAEGIDQILWWEVTDFRPSGVLTSSILDAGEALPSPVIDWNATLPPDGAVSLRVRSGDDPEAMGAWSAPLTAPGDLGEALARCVQIEIRLESSTVAWSPIFHDLALAWTSGGSACHGLQGDAGPALRGPCPTGRGGEIGFDLPHPMHVRLQLYDAAGRMVRELADNRLPGGHHRRGIGDTTPGVYLCRLVAGEQRMTGRVVVVE